MHGGKAGESTGGNEGGVGGMQSFVSNAVKGRRERRRGRQPPDVVVTPSKPGELSLFCTLACSVLICHYILLRTEEVLIEFGLSLSKFTPPYPQQQTSIYQKLLRVVVLAYLSHAVLMTPIHAVTIFIPEGEVHLYLPI